MRALLTALVLTLHLLALPACAQDRATLVADSVTVQSGSVLIADGHVEVFFKGQRLMAANIRYDRTTDRLLISGPIRIDDGKGNVFLADQADLKADLTEGILTSARLVLNQQLQLSAATILRTDGGNLTALRRVAVSSCMICKGSTIPLWEIRASEVVHDASAQQLYFSDAVLRFYGLPVLYVPMLRVPDPTLQRATGFLIPRLRSTSALGAGLMLPYFIPLGPSRDLTLTPYFTVRADRTLELRYRQAFANGAIEVNGNITRDDLGPPNPRFYLEAQGNFALAADYKLRFYGITVSDPAYLLDYGIANEDRLDSLVELSRVKRNLYFSARLDGFQSIRAGESNLTLPSVVTDLTIHRRFEPAILGGEGEFQIQTHSAYRASNSVVDGNGDGIADGRDLGRITLNGAWRRNWTASSGIELSALADVTAEYYSIAQDPAYGGAPSRITGTTGVEVRWPWVKANASGVSQLIEPVLQIVVAPKPDSTIPNEDSSLVEFDESNLLAMDRFPGADAFEGGTRANIGVNYLRDDPLGWSLGITGGRVIRLEDLGQFSTASGLSGQKSDWLLATSVADASGLSLTNRLLLDDTLTLTKGELRFDLARPNGALSGGYEYLLADPSEGRPDPTAELVLDARYDFARNWSAGLSDRYDLLSHRTATAGLELNFRNECVDFNLSLSRRYTSSISVNPSTDFGLSVQLLGFGGGTATGAAQTCRR